MTWFGRSAMISTPMSVIEKRRADRQEQHAERDGEDRRHQDKRRDHIRLVAVDQPVIGRMGDHRDDQRREGDAAEELQAACKGVETCPLSKRADARPSGRIALKPAQAWNCRA